MPRGSNLWTGSVRIVGNGRAGGAFALALEAVGWQVVEVLGRGDDLARAGDGVDLVLICVDDAEIASVANTIEPHADTVVAHVSGSLGLGVLATHVRPGALHPLVSLPSADVGARRLADNAWFAVAGDPMVSSVVEALGGHSFAISDEDRPRYHAAACIASNHLVALLGQVERVSASVGAPMDAYLDLVRGTVANVAELGAAAALTGPAARGDESTIELHIASLDPSERATYRAMADEARRLAGGQGDA